MRANLEINGNKVNPAMLAGAFEHSLAGFLGAPKLQAKPSILNRLSIFARKDPASVSPAATQQAAEHDMPRQTHLPQPA